MPLRLFFSSLDFSEISKGSRVKCFGKFPKGEGLNRLRKFTSQGTCSHIHSEVFLGNMRRFWDSVCKPVPCKNKQPLEYYYGLKGLLKHKTILFVGGSKNI
jgi:hypothetical protein